MSRHAEVQLIGNFQRPSDLGAQYLSQRAARGPPNQLAYNKPKGQHVVAGHCPWCPPWTLPSDERAHAPCIAKIPGGDLRPQSRHAGGMDEHVSERHDVLAVRAEFWPRIRHAFVICELAAFDEHVHH